MKLKLILPSIGVLLSLLLPLNVAKHPEQGALPVIDLSHFKPVEALPNSKAIQLATMQRKIIPEAPKPVIEPVKPASTNSCDELRQKMAGLGLTGAELDAAITLAMRESSCQSSSINAETGACGEYQSNPCGKWGTPGTTEYLTHAIAYTRERYGSYQAALAHSYANNWY